MKITFIGHVCIDKNIIHSQTETFYGGGVVHGAVTASRLGAQVTVITKCAEKDRAGFTAFDGTGVKVVFLTSASSTSIRNIYPTDNPDDRQSHLISRADPFSALEIEMLNDDIVHLNPLWHGEFPLSLLPQIKRRAGVLSGDAQGFLRHAGRDGSMIYHDFPEKRDALSWFDVFKVDAKEAHILTGEDEVRASARAVHELGPRIVLLTHRGGVCVFDGKECYESPFTSFTLEGRTGRGDTCTGAFLTAMQQMSLRDAAALAAEVTSRKMQYRGPYRG